VAREEQAASLKSQRRVSEFFTAIPAIAWESVKKIYIGRVAEL
jgi:hypothetical protein